jgi:membrane protein DedA with SNARE-associated domain
MKGAMGIIESVVQIILDLIGALGLPGVFGLMTLESMCLPIPSEIVMTFAGALVFQGESTMLDGSWLGLIAVTMAGTLGCAVGSIIAYYIGERGGRPFVLRYGKYVLLNEKHLDSAERWFIKYGDMAVFVSRLLPVVRTFISLPAGMAKMNFTRFVVLSFIGSLPWCFALTYLGYILGANWQAVEGVFRQLDILIVVAGVAVVIWYIWDRKRKAKFKVEGEMDQE